jgi:hypothetical protein
VRGTAGTAPSSVSAKPCPTSILFTNEDPLLLLVVREDRANFDGFVALKGWPLSYPLGRDAKAGENLTIRGFRAGKQAQTIARFISIAAQYIGGAP